MVFRDNCKYDIAAVSSMGLRLCPSGRQSLFSGAPLQLQATSAETNVLSALSSLGMRTLMSNLMHHALEEEKEGLKAACTMALENGIPAPCLTAAMQYFNGYTNKDLPANLLQGMRDLFGAHTYERTDAPRGEFFHTEW